MTTFLKTSEAPKTKNELRKAIIAGAITLFENDYERDEEYRKVEDPSFILFQIWAGFRYAPKYQNPSKEVEAYIGTSFTYKLAKA